MEIEEQSLEEYKISHAKTFVEQGLASNFDGSLDSLMPQVIRYGSDNEVTPIMIGTLAMRQFAQLVVKELEPVFGICHTYDMVDRYHETLKVNEVASKLKGVVSEKYQWPDEVGEGYHLEFILHPDGTLILDFLNQESAIFWSEAKSVYMQTPFNDDGEPITCEDLKQVGIPFMS